MNLRFGSYLIILFGGIPVLIGCASIVHPPGEMVEQSLASTWRPPGNDIAVPELAKDAPIREVLRNGFARNPKIRAAFNDWVAALERVPQAGALPDPRFDLSIDAQYLLGFDPARRLGLQSARRLTMKPDGGDEVNSSMREHEGSGRLLDALGIGFSQQIPGRGKRAARADQALAGARATGLRFLNAERELRRDIVKAYADLLLNRRRAEVEQENVRLLTSIHDITLDNLSAGIGNEADVLKSEIAITQSQTDLKAVEIQEPNLAGKLNALIARNPEDSFGKLSGVKTDWQDKKTAELLKTAVTYNPRLSALATDIQKQNAAIVLARLERNPDFTLGTSIGAWQQMLRAGLSLPINNERIDAGIREAQATGAAAQNRYSAAVFETMANLVAALATVKDSNRILEDYGERMVPQLRQLTTVQLKVYGSGAETSFLDILDTRRSLIQAERLIIQAEAERLKSMAELEEITGSNLLTLKSSSVQLIKPVDLDEVQSKRAPALPGEMVGAKTGVQVNLETDRNVRSADETDSITTRTALDISETSDTGNMRVLPSLIEAPRKPDTAEPSEPGSELLTLPPPPADSGTTIGQGLLHWRPLADL